MLIEIKDKLLYDISRSPSVHNVQPFVVKIDDQKISIYDDNHRILKVGDPDEHDHQVSLGVMIESCAISLSHFGFQIENLRFFKVETERLRLRAEITVISSAHLDPLYSFLHLRKCFRGQFQKINKEQETKYCLELATLSNLSILSQLTKEAWAQKYDHSSYKFLSQKSYMNELYSWMRLSKEHPQYHEDGLNAQALSLSPLEAFFAKFLLKPKNYEVLKKLGLGKIVISEASQIKSSIGIVAITAPHDTSLVDQGRILLRTWLEITKIGLYVTPLSALTDDRETKNEMMKMIPKDRAIVLPLRVGIISTDKIYTSPRRNLEYL